MFTSSDIYQNTCLGSIINDLRPIIDMYIDYYSPFAVGVANKKYSGYRLVTREDIENKSFCTALANHYQKNNGLRSLDNFWGLYLCGDNIDISVDDMRTRISGTSPYESIHISKHSMIQIHGYNNIIGITGYWRGLHDVGLLILVDHIF